MTVFLKSEVDFCSGSTRIYQNIVKNYLYINYILLCIDRCTNLRWPIEI